MTGYRWLTAQGAPCSPLHRSPQTAARWLARQARRPRIRPAPASLSYEVDGRRRWLSAVDREHLVRAAIAAPARSESARPFLRRQARTAQARLRRRASLPRLTSRLSTRGGTP